ncbi:phosphoribosylanthranilate isomerase [Chryseobacterium chendengshani]|uniref:phosphoribosylanthranilate isomerase n=1 Tax=Chryseobacterium sp. LJ756 TaxID=2864113 RepID=UPI001C63D543|nr:phosphoribosylanthranilate isomerase [Chryseobacterium sp. LJ756]MBW7673988.1 phosphoribosylanthranilate isomerase [Chryseobacterium sp. LJ756]
MTETQQQSTKNHQAKIKVCGLTKLDQIQELISMNVDFLGFIFYEKSPRYVLNHLTVEEISEINHSEKVGVFVNENLDSIIEIAEKADLNLVQLHGDENEEFISDLRKKLNKKTEIIKVIRVGNQSSDELQETINSQPSTINYLLFDTDSKTYGGTGETFDWNIINEIETPIPYFLSGGISLENIENIELLNLKPFALDINSKFEIEPGNKDVEKIKEIIQTLKSPKGTT